MTDSTDQKSANPSAMPDPATASLYDRLGGEAGVQMLVTTFYDLMATSPDAELILGKHRDLADARQKLFEYFSGWFGGPGLFIEKYGHPRLRARHKHIAIGLEDRDSWLNCFRGALDKMALTPGLRADLLAKVEPMADHMRNMPDESPLTDC